MASPRPITTSHTLVRVLDAMRSDRDPVVEHMPDDLVLHDGAPTPLRHAIEAVGRQVFDLIVVVDAAVGLRVVHGEDRRDEAVEAAGRGPATSDMDLVRSLLVQDHVSTLVIIDQATLVLPHDPWLAEERARSELAALLRGLHRAGRVGHQRNTCVTLTDDAGRLPAELRDGLTVTHVLVTVPAREERRALLESYRARLAGGLTAEELDAALDRLAAISEGESMRSVVALANYCGRPGVAVTDTRATIAAFRHGPRGADPWAGGRDLVDGVVDTFGQRIVGQEQAILALTEAVAGASVGLEFGHPSLQQRPPRGVFLFTGLTATGKTETSKALADGVFGDPESLIVIDMNNYTAPHDVAKLIGAPPGYVGYDDGGQLNKAVRRKPFSVVLFDEVEKAHPDAFKYLAQILDEGRITDGRGNVVDFSETVIILSANIGAADVRQLLVERGVDVSYDEVQHTLQGAVADHFAKIGQEHVLGRIEDVVGFDVLRAATIDGLTAKFVREANFRNGVALDVDLSSAQVRVRAHMSDPDVWILGGRSVRSFLKAELRRVALWSVTEVAATSTVHVRWEGDALVVRADDGPEVTLDRP